MEPLCRATFCGQTEATTVRRAAVNLERFDIKFGGGLRSPTGRAVIIIALTYLTLEELASRQAVSLLKQALTKAKKMVDIKEKEYLKI